MSGREPGTCYCSGCRNTFADVPAFDAHRGTRGAHGECRDVGGVPGLELRDGMWHGPGMLPEAVR